MANWRTRPASASAPPYYIGSRSVCGCQVRQREGRLPLVTCRRVALRYTSSHLPPLLRPKPDPPPSTTVCPPPWRSATSFCLPPPSEQGRCSMWLFPHYIQSHTRPLSSPHIHIHIHIHKPPHSSPPPSSRGPSLRRRLPRQQQPRARPPLLPR
jgi:hypothetical protein